MRSSKNTGRHGFRFGIPDLPAEAHRRGFFEGVLQYPDDYPPLKAIGNRLGTGGVIVFDHKICLVRAALNLTEFFVRESCAGAPLPGGLPFIRDLLWRIEHGEGEEDFIPC